MELVLAYHELIETIVTVTGSSHQQLHVHCGLAIYVVAQMALGTRRGSTAALQAVLAIELGNEVMNRLFYGSWRWADTGMDILITMFWPVTLVMLSKFRRWRWRIRAERRQLLHDLATLSPRKA